MTAGVVVLDKPAGLSSAQALAPLKRAAGRKTKVGHAGTLDPFATGVLLALVGDATRLSDLAMKLPKTYRATVRFGIATDTLDPEGAELARADPGPERPAALPDVLRRFVGEIEQLPPDFSALKVGGRRAYRLARAGKQPELRPRPVVIHSLRLAGGAWPEAKLEVVCGAGTYVRALARDLGAALELPAHLAALRRTAVGPYLADEGCLPEAADPGCGRPLLELIQASAIPLLELGEERARHFARGGDQPVPETDPTCAVVSPRVGLVGLGRIGGGRLHPRIVLSEARRLLES
jgi:tRNA pseudouridine55 synthase